jgi:hypothetical protein
MIAAQELLVDDPGACSLQDLDRPWYVHAAQEIIDVVLDTKRGAKQLTCF